MKNISTAILISGLLLVLACAKRPYLSSSKTGEEAYQECHALSEKKDYEEANECFEILKSRFAGSPASHEADLEIGDNYFRKGDFLLAAETYVAFVKLHPSHERIGYAYYKAGLSYLREAPKAIDRDQKYLKEAIHYLELAAAYAADDLREVTIEKLREARTRVAKRHFYVGRFYYRTGEYLAAIPRFEEIVTNFSGLGLDEKALYFLGDSYRRLNDKEKGLEILSVFEQHFPQSEYRKRLAQKMGAPQ